MFRMRFLSTMIIILALFASPISNIQGMSELNGNLFENNGPISASAALTIDGKSYGSQFDVTLDEALLRFSYQVLLDDLNGKLMENDGDTFAGFWIQNEPSYHIIAFFTRDGEKTLEKYITNQSLYNLIEVKSVNKSINELFQIQSQVTIIAKSIGITVHTGINPMANTVEVYVLNLEQFNSNLHNSGAILPSNTTVIQVDQFPQEVTNIYGGLSTQNCTTGFSVSYYSGQKGVTSAGHCHGQTLYGLALTIVWDTEGALDIEWGYNNQLTPINYFDAGSGGGRNVTSTVHAANIIVGDYVCRYGKTSNYACGQIVAPLYFDGRNFVFNGLLVQPGDSGGPWFWGNTAWGTTISQWVPYSIFGPINNIEAMSVYVLTN